MEALFKQVRGVLSVTSGYAGGTQPNPTYEQVCSGRTGHAEVIQIQFDPAIISYDELLTLFFAAHDPTTPNQQGADVGTQYRSIILTTNPLQQSQAQAHIRGPIVTQVQPLTVFYPAETYHQDYFSKNPKNSYCKSLILPKTIKMRERFGSYFKEN
jgi:peptide-methionine (S)-S-oxide reductase